MRNTSKERNLEVMKILSEFGEDSSALWNCHGTQVILHKALERIADKAGIKFDAPQIVETDAAKKIAVICVTGHRDKATAWSFGEAMPSNNKNSYPFAMAEKRAKDRVILKLIGISGDVYSEEEADDFKNARPAFEPITPAPLKEDMKDFINLPSVKSKSAHQSNKDRDFERLRDMADADITNPKHVPAWVQENAEWIASMPATHRHYLKEHIEGIIETLKQPVT